MLTTTKSHGKTKATRTTVTFDSTRHRNRYSASFAAGLVEPTYWCGDHRYAPFTQEEADFAAQCFCHASAAEIDAEEEAYHQMLDALAFEDAAVGRLSRGHCM